MKRFVSALLVAGLLSVGASSAMAAPRVSPPAPSATLVCTMGSTSVSTASLVAAGLTPRAAQRIMDLIISFAHRIRGAGVSCSAAVTTPPPPVTIPIS